MADSESFEDSPLLICPNCKILSFDNKICVACGSSIPEDMTYKYLDENNIVHTHEVFFSNLHNVSNSLFCPLKYTSSSKTEKERKCCIGDTEANLHYGHDKDCASLKLIRPEEEVRAILARKEEEERKKKEEEREKEMEECRKMMEECVARKIAWDAAEEEEMRIFLLEETETSEISPEKISPQKMEETETSEISPEKISPQEMEETITSEISPEKISPQEIKDTGKISPQNKEEHTTGEKSSSPATSGSTSVDFIIYDKDIKTLDCGERLNDSVIDFYLNYVYRNKIPAELQVRTHIFNSFFHQFLRKAFDENVADKNWSDKTLQNQVKRWTKNVDIFSKKFIFIPVNYIPVNCRNGHWYLSVVCFLSELDKYSYAETSVESSFTTAKSSMSSDSSTITCSTDSGCLDTGWPCILFFDSVSTPGEINEDKRIIAGYIIQFLQMLWNNKNPEKPFVYERLPLFNSWCPQQDKSSVDCGLYLLQYVESFFESPIPQIGSSCPILPNWFPEEKMTLKRDEVREVILEVLKKKFIQEKSDLTESDDSDIFIVKDYAP